MKSENIGIEAKAYMSLPVLNNARDKTRHYWTRSENLLSPPYIFQWRWCWYLSCGMLTIRCGNNMLVHEAPQREERWVAEVTDVLSRNLPMPSPR